MTVSAARPAPSLPEDLAGLQAAVLAWYERERRDLPFRRTRDPYPILVSEAMAQQTQIGRVAEAWTRFVTRFPTVEALAAAPLDEVLRAWAGLGYNRRAVHLHRAARAIVDEHRGRIPDDPAALEALPGVGPYTARAVAAIAFGRRVGAVDTNVRRVLTRVVAGTGSLGAAHLQALADAAVPEGRAAEWTGALMDVGTRHCRPTPRCEGCPARAWCRFPDAVATAAERLTGRVPDATTPRGRKARAGATGAFHASSRWLRGRIVERLRASDRDTWSRFEGPLGVHEPEAVAVALSALAADGLVELHPADPSLARLARG